MIGRTPPLGSAYDYLVAAPSANPFLLRWRRPREVAGAGFQYVKAPRSVVPSHGGYSLHPGDNTENPQPVGVWHHVSIEPREALLAPGTTIESGIDASAIESRGNRASMLKGRITLNMGNARERDFDFDIGAGVDFCVRSYAVKGIDVLVPDPASGGITPEDVVANPFALGTIFTTALYCSDKKSHGKNPLTYTQSFLVDETGLTMPVMPAARDVIILIENPAAAPITVNMIYGFANPIVPTNAAPIFPSAVISALTIPAGATTSPIIPIPGNVNAFAINLAAGAVIITIVQILNL